MIPPLLAAGPLYNPTTDERQPTALVRGERGEPAKSDASAGWPGSPSRLSRGRMIAVAEGGSYGVRRGNVGCARPSCRPGGPRPRAREGGPGRRSLTDCHGRRSLGRVSRRPWAVRNWEPLPDGPGRTIGIDLGTTNSAVAEAVFDPKNPHDIKVRSLAVDQ